MLNDEGSKRRACGAQPTLRTAQVGGGEFFVDRAAAFEAAGEENGFFHAHFAGDEIGVLTEERA